MDKSGPDKGKLSKGRLGKSEGTLGKKRQSSGPRDGKSAVSRDQDKKGGFSSERKAGGFPKEGRPTAFSKGDKPGGFSKEGPKRTGKPVKKDKVAKVVKAPGDDSIRLNKFIAASGICSRREADQLISAGVITVNGESITQLGTKIKPGDDIRYNGKRMKTERKVYLLLNKPKDYVTTTEDPKERKTVMNLIEDACTERVYPVGRLDRQTTGVLLFTNDGELAKKLTHPGYNKKKIYHIHLDKGVTSGDLRKLAEGLTLDDGFIQPDAVSYAAEDSKKEVGLEIHSGRNRIVRRMFEHLEYRVVKLDRVYFAGLTKKNLTRGKWRFLSEKEISQLKMNAYE